MDIYAGSVFVQQSLGWNSYISIAAILLVTAVYTVVGRSPVPDRQTERQTDRQTERQTDGKTDRQKDRRTDRDRRKDRQTDGQTDEQTNRQTDRKANLHGTPQDNSHPINPNLLYFTGGLAAVIFTDTLQTIIMLAGSVVLAILGM